MVKFNEMAWRDLIHAMDETLFLSTKESNQLTEKEHKEMNSLVEKMSDMYEQLQVYFEAAEMRCEAADEYSNLER